MSRASYHGLWTNLHANGMHLRMLLSISGQAHLPVKGKAAVKATEIYTMTSDLFFILYLTCGQGHAI